jgi:hypothetical protein
MGPLRDFTALVKLILACKRWRAVNAGRAIRAAI